MPIWLKIIMQVLPSVVKLVLEILEMIRNRPKAMRDSVKAEIRQALKEKRFGKIQEILERLKKEQV